MPETRSDRKKSKELTVLELYDQGLSYRKIAKEAHLSLRDITRFVRMVSNKTRSPTSTSIMDEVVLEYRVTGLRREVKDLQMEKDNLMNEVKDLRAQKYDVMNQLRARQSELDAVKRDLEYEKFSKEVLKDIFTESQ